MSQLKQKSSLQLHNLNISDANSFIQLLVQDNDQNASNMTPLLNLRSTFDLISKLCIQMNFVTETEFCAFDCLESVYEKYFFEVISKNDDPENFHMICSEFKDETTSIIFLTVSIAAKYMDASTQFGLHQVNVLIEKVTGMALDMEELKERKHLLFKMMDYKVCRPIAFESMENMMKLIFDQRNVRVGLKKFLEAGCLLLRFAYIEKHQIYSKLSKGVDEDIKFKKFASDKVLLGAGVVYASCHVVNATKSWILKIQKKLSDASSHAERDIVIVGNTILKVFNE